MDSLSQIISMKNYFEKTRPSRKNAVYIERSYFISDVLHTVDKAIYEDRVNNHDYETLISDEVAQYCFKTSDKLFRDFLNWTGKSQLEFAPVNSGTYFTDKLNKEKKDRLKIINIDTGKVEDNSNV